MHPTQQLAQGYVYCQHSNRGIPGVMVSNQHQVVLTDESGYYELPLTEDCAIFLSKPSNYHLPLNEYNQPQFYYLYRPNGSPEPERLSPYPAIKATGIVPNPLNFYLIPGEEQANFTAVLMGDIQPETSREVEYFKRLAVPTLQEEVTDLLIPLGDLAWDELEVHPEVREAIGEIGKPWYAVMGNHDINIRASRNQYARESFQYFFGPTYYSFDYGQVHFVVLDDVDYSGWNTRRDEQGITEGKLDARQLEWLKNDLARVPDEKLVFLLSHIPIYTKTASQNPYRNIVNRRELYRVLKNRRKLFAVAAHTHTIEHVELNEGGWEQGQTPFPELIAGAICGAWWQGPLEEDGLPVRMAMDGAPNGYFVFHFNGTELEYTFRALGVKGNKAKYALRFPRANEKTVEVLVNAFAAAPDSRVEVRWDDGAFMELQQFEGTDAYVEAFLKTHREKYDIWMGPKVNRHLWKGNLPKELSVGKHKIEVRIVEKNKAAYGGTHIVEINHKGA